MSTPDSFAVRWRKSSYSGNGNDANCVEIAFPGSSFALRDSKAPADGALVLPLAAWSHLRSALTR